MPTNSTSENPEVLSYKALRQAVGWVALARAVADGLVAFPTETVYGLGARGLRGGEVTKIFEAKGRPKMHPLILHVTDVAMAKRIASEWPDGAKPVTKAAEYDDLYRVTRQALTM